MAAAQKVVTVDLGTSTLKFGEFGIGRGGALTLLRYGIAEIGLDPNKEEVRSKFITPTLAKLFKDHGIRAGEVLLSISGQSVFMRFVKLPAINTTQVEQVVEFEAKQNVPFPIDEVTWDYQMMPNRTVTAGSDAEAVIVAIKKDMLESEVDAVVKAGMKIKRVDVAPFALLNAFRYSEPQTDDCSLIIDMGARSTNLVFVEKSSFWIRNIPIAGNQISQNICNDLQEPFIAAETLKKGKGFVSLGGVYADPEDADAARISKIIRSTMTKLHVDINRSIAYYRTTLNGGPPKRVFLTGGSSQLPYLDLFIADKLSLPVVYFNPLRNVDLAPSLNREHLQQNNCCTAELVGLALRATGSCPAEVNLEAPSLAARADKRRKLPYYFCALIVWIILFACLSLSFWQQINLTTATAAKLRSETENLKHNASEIRQLAVQADSLDQVRSVVAALGLQRNAWPEILSALNDKIPTGVWITELTPIYDAASASGNRSAPPPAGLAQVPDQINVLVINGLYHSNSRTMQVDSTSLGAFINALATLPYFNINTARTSETLISFTTPDTDPNSFAQRFSIRLKLKNPIIVKLDSR